MRVDLFSSQEVGGEAFRLGNHVETRKFNLHYPLNRVREELKEYPQGIVDNYLNRLQALADAGREYKHIGNSACDNLWELECLGLGKYTKEYMNVIDFSDALDYVMHREFKCSLAEVRGIQDYAVISNGMLNFDFSNVYVGLGTILIDSPAFMSELANMIKEVTENNTAIDATVDERIAQLVSKFYQRILNQLDYVKNYVVADLQRQYPKEFVFRSKSFSSVILTSDHPFNETIELYDSSYEPYSVKITSYKRCEWAREGITYEISRNTNNW